MVCSQVRAKNSSIFSPCKDVNNSVIITNQVSCSMSEDGKEILMPIVIFNAICQITSVLSLSK